MKITFSKHAKFRCLQRKIPEQWVSDLLQNIPLSPGNHNHLMERTRLVVVYRDDENERTVITLYAYQPAGDAQKKVLNLSNQDKGLMDKERQKQYRRQNKRRVLKHKFKKR